MSSVKPGVELSSQTCRFVVSTLRVGSGTIVHRAGFKGRLVQFWNSKLSVVFIE